MTYAKDHPTTKLTRAADKVRAAIKALEAVVIDHQDNIAANEAANKEREALRARIADTEARLAALKAQLRSKPGTKPKTSRPKGDPTPGDHACRYPNCTKTFALPGGRGLHEKAHRRTDPTWEGPR